MASAGPYASLHLAPDRQPRQHPTTQFVTGRMSFLPPNQQRQSTEGSCSRTQPAARRLSHCGLTSRRRHNTGHFGYVMLRYVTSPQAKLSAWCAKKTKPNTPNKRVFRAGLKKSEVSPGRRIVQMEGRSTDEAGGRETPVTGSAINLLEAAGSGHNIT